tara:strand:+ start:2043 stop:2321 length:279 start_codon:yes stop_codon:yes gene_type:complete
MDKPNKDLEDDLVFLLKKYSKRKDFDQGDFVSRMSKFSMRQIYNMTDDPIVATGLITSIWNNILIDISVSVEELNETDAENIEDFDDLISIH